MGPLRKNRIVAVTAMEAHRDNQTGLEATANAHRDDQTGVETTAREAHRGSHCEDAS